MIYYLALLPLSHGYRPSFEQADRRLWTDFESSEHIIRLPRRIFHHHRKHHRKTPQDGIAVEPRAFEVDTLPSTPQLNAIMDRAMGKVKSMVKELEDEEGKNNYTALKSPFFICKIKRGKSKAVVPEVTHFQEDSKRRFFFRCRFLNSIWNFVQTSRRKLVGTMHSGP